MRIIYRNKRDYIQKLLLSIEARIVRKRRNPYIVTIAGSVGKTSTTYAISTVLSSAFKVRSTEGNFNALVGACRTVLGLESATSTRAWMKNLWFGLTKVWSSEEYPECLVIETGISKQHGMEQFLWLKPNIVVFTLFPDMTLSHAEHFTSSGEVVREKMKLYSALQEDGVLVINADDPKMRALQVTEGQKQYSYGMSKEADVVGLSHDIYYTNGVVAGMVYRIAYKKEEGEIVLKGVLGKHHMYPFLSATAVGIAKGMLFTKIITALNTHIGPRSRMRIIEGIKEAVVIDDSYNASPIATIKGLETVQRITCSGKKIIILGDMLELGEQSENEHERILDKAEEVGDVVYTYGALQKKATEAKEREVRYVEDQETLICTLKESLQKGDVVYVKGSAGMQMERVVKGVMKDPDTAKDLLVRQ